MKLSSLERLRVNVSEKTMFNLACAAVFCLPLKLSIAYAFIIPLIVLWILSSRNDKGSLPKLYLPFLTFFAVACLSSFFGIDPTRSLFKFISPLFFSIGILVYADLIRKRGFERIVGATLAGQTVAGLYTVLSGLFVETPTRIFMGQVTESGQLAIQIPLALGLATWYLHKNFSSGENPPSANLLKNIPLAALSFCTFSLACLAGFLQSITYSGSLAFGVAVALFLSIACNAIYAAKPDRRMATVLTTIVLPLLTAAFLVNLKRGPWLGVFVGVTVFLLIYARVLIVPLIIATLTTLAMFEPIRTRLALSTAHFFISGGRNVIWKIGTELATRFPLGIGYHNSPYLRNFSVEIPPQHNHFHNDILNVLVETGWLGVACYLWWIGAMLWNAYSGRTKSKIDIMSCAVGCAILSWQVAGLVEYNFGDSEVVELVFFQVGLLVALREPLLMQNAESVSENYKAVATA